MRLDVLQAYPFTSRDACDCRNLIQDQILGFVAPHGLLELVAICVAGAAGLHLAVAILLPGALTRREALVARGRRALTLVAGATVMLVVAGLLEGYVSPLVFPLSQKLWITVGTAVALVGWWCVGMTLTPPPVPSAPGSD